MLAACSASSARTTNFPERGGALGTLSRAEREQATPQSRQIDAVMEVWAHDDSPGCALAVIQRGELVHAKGYGMADLEHGVPITPDTVFDIGSISKQFIASAVLLAAAEGKLGLDDDVRLHAPALPKLGKTPTTLRQLLHHTGGLRDYGTILMLGGTREDGFATARDAIEALARQRELAFEPGTKWEYSGSGYFILGKAVEHATKQSLASYLEAKVFDPLDMSRTQVLDDTKQVVPGRAIGYAPRNGAWRIDMSGWTGDGMVLSTVLDLAKWDANFYEPKVGGKRFVDELQTRGKLADGTQLDYAAGLVHANYRGQPIVYHSGAWVGYRAQFERFPVQRTSVILLCNSATARPEELARRIADIVLAKELQDEPNPPPLVDLSAAELDEWVATYREVATGQLITILREGDSLKLDTGDDRIALRPTSKRVVRIEATTPMSVVLDGVKPRRNLTVTDQSFEVQFDEVELQKPAAWELAELVGRYRSDEIGTEWSLSVADGSLVATGRGLDESLLLSRARTDELVYLPPSGANAESIMSGGATFRFTRDKRARVTGFLLSVSNTRGLRFDRVP